MRVPGPGADDRFMPAACGSIHLYEKVPAVIKAYPFQLFLAILVHLGM